MNYTNTIINVGVNDSSIDLFEGQYTVPTGISYNSYLVLDEKNTLFDSVDSHFSTEWLENIDKALEGKELEYFIIQHMEPDHSGSINTFLQKYKNTKIVSNAKIFSMIEQFFDIDFEFEKIIVKDGESINMGKHDFTFVFAPMVHWPEVMVTYDSYSKTLFSADAFGTFGIYEKDAIIDVDEWKEEASRYFIGIVGKYGVQVQTLLKKASALDIERICSLHGPVLTENLDKYINLYDTWSSYKTEKDGVVIAYSSAYGHTEKAAKTLFNLLQEKSVGNVRMYDLARCDTVKAIADSFRYSKLVLASITYNANISPFMQTFIHGLLERNFQNKTIGFVENGSWAPMANKTMKSLFEKSKNIVFAEHEVTIKSSLKTDSYEALENLAEELAK